MLRFHTPGIPQSSTKYDLLSGLESIAEMGLDGIEIQFTRGVRMKDELAEAAHKKANELGLTITAHGPFWINLNSQEETKQKASQEYIFQTIQKGHTLGAKSITFHPAYMHKNTRGEVLRQTSRLLKEVTDKTVKEGIDDVLISPELTGKESQFGSIDDLIDLSLASDKKIALCIDFTHYYARTIGKANGREIFQEVIDKIKTGLGDEFLRHLHIHMGGMIYGPKGERKHRPLEEEDEFEWKELLKVLKENNVSGWVSVETPDIEVSTKVAKDYYHSL